MSDIESLKITLQSSRQVMPDDATVVNINHIHVPARKEFLTIKELSEQIPFGRAKIIEMIKDGRLHEEQHFCIINKKYVFYFPAIVALFKPKLAGY